MNLFGLSDFEVKIVAYEFSAPLKVFSTIEGKRILKGFLSRAGSASVRRIFLRLALLDKA
jgi:hypothetical protein